MNKTEKEYSGFCTSKQILLIAKMKNFRYLFVNPFLPMSFSPIIFIILTALFKKIQYFFIKGFQNLHSCPTSGSSTKQTGIPPFQTLTAEIIKIFISRVFYSISHDYFRKNGYSCNIIIFSLERCRKPVVNHGHQFFYQILFSVKTQTKF